MKKAGASRSRQQKPSRASTLTQSSAVDATSAPMTGWSTLTRLRSCASARACGPWPRAAHRRRVRHSVSSWVVEVDTDRSIGQRRVLAKEREDVRSTKRACSDNQPVEGQMGRQAWSCSLRRQHHIQRHQRLQHRTYAATAAASGSCRRFSRQSRWITGRQESRRSSYIHMYEYIHDDSPWGTAC